MDEQKEQVDMEREPSGGDRFSEELYAEILKEVAEITAAVPEDVPAAPEPAEQTVPGAVIVPAFARKKRKRRLWLWLLIPVLVLALAGGAFCLYYFQLREPPAERVILSRSNVILREGERITLTCKVVPSDASQAVTWAVSDPSVLRISQSGSVTIVSTGICTVSATAPSGAQARCFIRVRPPLTVEEAALVGTWSRFAVSQRGNITYHYDAAYTLDFKEDRTGLLTQEGEEYTFRWEFDEAIDGYCYYAIDLSDHRDVILKLNANTGDAMTDTLTMELEESLLWVFSMVK